MEKVIYVFSSSKYKLPKLKELSKQDCEKLYEETKENSWSFCVKKFVSDINSDKSVYEVLHANSFYMLHQDYYIRAFGFGLEEMNNYRAYNNAQEFLQDSRLHGPYIRYNNDIILPISVRDDGIEILGSCSIEGTQALAAGLNFISFETFLDERNYCTMTPLCSWQDGSCLLAKQIKWMN